jgi:hypothetical protein
LICTDPPYNVPIDGHVCGSGCIRHRNFAMGVGEMNKDQFTRFLADTLGRAAARCRDGAIAFVFMDWRHMGELLNAGEQVFSELKKPVCLEQDQRRHGDVLSVEARVDFRVQGRNRAACDCLARSCDTCVWLPAVGWGTAMIHPLIRRLHTLQMHGSPDSMRPLGGSGGEHRADKVH